MISDLYHAVLISGAFHLDTDLVDRSREVTGEQASVCSWKCPGRYQNFSIGRVVARDLQCEVTLRVDCRKAEGVHPNDFRNAAVK